LGGTSLNHAWRGMQLGRAGWGVTAHQSPVFLLSRGSSLSVHHPTPEHPSWPPTAPSSQKAACGYLSRGAAVPLLHLARMAMESDLLLPETPASPVRRQQNASAAHRDTPPRERNCRASRARLGSASSQPADPAVSPGHGAGERSRLPALPGARFGRGHWRSPGCLAAGPSPASDSHLPACSFFPAETSR